MITFFINIFKVSYTFLSQVALVVKNRETCETQVRSLGQEDPLEEGRAIHSSILA